MVKETFKIEWDGHEYEHKERSSDWFWAVGIITVAVALTSIILGNIIFALLIIVSAFALLLFINRPPETLHIIVDEKGITKGRVRYPFDTLHSFYIDIDHPHKKILLRSKKMFMPLIVVPLGEKVDIENVETNLLKFIPQEPLVLPFAEQILEYLGF
ncbi:MAG: hypothetical protein ACYC1K_02715 [Minisyncoccota bacterium]